MAAGSLVNSDHDSPLQGRSAGLPDSSG
jgi:hypothetical protein